MQREVEPSLRVIEFEQALSWHSSYRSRSVEPETSDRAIAK